MKKIILVNLALSTLLAFYSSTLKTAYSKKRIVRRTSSSSTTTVSTSSDRLIIQPKLRNDRKALVVNFSNFGAVSSFTYELSYDSEGVPQGVGGTVTPSGEGIIQRELLFGTCSKNVCRYHHGITEMKFVVTSTLKSGVRVRKSYQIRV